MTPYINSQNNITRPSKTNKNDDKLIDQRQRKSLVLLVKELRKTIS